MTGTAFTEAEEFLSIYGLDTIMIPTNKSAIRMDKADQIYKNQKGKYMAVVKRVKELHEKGQPVLIGTISIEKSEILSRLLQIEGIPHNVLNAKQHEREAEIVSNAGQKNAVTIATNMAGRGTDIKLGEEVKDLGGLVILGTERHESRRIDNQLRGRSGRQGDPGESQFYLSMEDDLMRLFGSDRILGMMEALKLPDDMPIENKWISNAIESAQKKVEGRNFDIRKHLVEYDDVMNKHREIIYARRRKVLFSENIKNDILILVEKEVEKIVLDHNTRAKENEGGTWNINEMVNEINGIHRNQMTPITNEDLAGISDPEDMIEKIKQYLFREYTAKESLLADPETMRKIERGVNLNVIDTLWMEHIDNMQHLRDEVSLRGYAQRDPLIEYKEEAYMTFSKLLGEIQSNTVGTIFKINLKQQLPEHMLKGNQPKVLITNENQIEHVLGGENKIGKPQSTQSGSVSASTYDSTSQNGNPVVIKTTGTSAKTAQQEEIGRNEPCPCGSGKKYKKCHGV
jgi:preprotein translocase subunit SecA